MESVGEIRVYLVPGKGKSLKIGSTIDEEGDKAIG